jgi:hypothetical protein
MYILGITSKTSEEKGSVDEMVEIPSSARQITLTVRWAYVPSKLSTNRNLPSEARRILIGPIATGKRRYPWILEKNMDRFLEPHDFALIKPKEHRKKRGRVGISEGAIVVYRIVEHCSENQLNTIIKQFSKFCERWKKGIYGTAINSYQIALSRVVLQR